MLYRIYRYPAGQHGPEECFYIEFTQVSQRHEWRILESLIVAPGEELRYETHLSGTVIEVGPRLSVETPFSTNAVGICQSMRLPVVRIERSIRYPAGIEPVIDPMTQEIYPAPLESFDTEHVPEPVRLVDVLGLGRHSLVEENRVLGLGMDDADIDYELETIRRLMLNPTNVELMQKGNGNSEHSRHHFFRGIQVIDGVEMPESLMDVVKAPWKANPGNSLVAFHDNSGVIRGARIQLLVPGSPLVPSAFAIREVLQGITATAETHNHPTLIAPFPGANTGAGGRIRDSRAVGRGGLTHAGLAGYCVGNLFIPGYLIPGEDIGGEVVKTHASPLDILIQGSNGIHDYGNKIGEPLIGGFLRSFGQVVDGKRRESRKPVLYSAGFGRIDIAQVEKRIAEKGMLIVRIGGPAYRIGVGGGSASSMMQGANSAELDLKSVQRGNPEMENRVNRVIQACAEMGENNPIESIHDQGAGGPSNVLTELMEPVGGRIDIRKIVLGDKTMSVLEIWVAEYQEGYGVLIKPENLEVFTALCERERVNCEVLGEITGDGRVVVEDSADDTTPVNLKLADIMADVPRKRFASTRSTVAHPPLRIPQGLSVGDALRKVLKLPQVSSKGHLVHHVDRSVTGLVAQQQCCGPMQVAVANVAVTADGYFGHTGAAAALGEQPSKMLINPAAGARMAVAEMLTNMASAGITSIHDITCRANWMWAAKLPGEGALLYDAAVAMRDLMLRLGIKNDGGKDSLSMATKVGDTQVVSPGELVIMGYAPVPDIRNVVTPDFKGGGRIGLIDFGDGRDRLGGSSLAQTFGQLGNESPDLNDPDFFLRAFAAIQDLITAGLITAYHDRSDGGLITAIVEMCIAGNCGAEIEVPLDSIPLASLFNEEAGMVFECKSSSWDEVVRILRGYAIAPHILGWSDRDMQMLTITHDGEVVFGRPLTTLRQWWEETSTHLEALQTNPVTVRQEWESFSDERTIPYHTSFTPSPSVTSGKKPKVAIVREEGTNGDREMVAAFVTAGLDAWDINMQDILSGKLESLDQFQGLVFPGGFSYADVFGSARGWAGPIRFTPRIRDMFDRFYTREDTFTFGVCNGCQLMANIGWLPYRGIEEKSQPRFVHNASGRFESRWSAVKVLPSPAMLLRGMEGSILGIHVAHGEGRLLLPDPKLSGEILQKQLVPLAYVGPDGEPTDEYPYNPNGSPGGWTALCSPDGRHLAMMPHPERCFLPWQWPYVPEAWRASFHTSPWLQMFQNARAWCDDHS